MTTTAKEDAERAVIRAIDDYQLNHGYGPAFRDVAEAVGLALGTVHELARELRAQGRIRFDDNRARSLDVV